MTTALRCALAEPVPVSICAFFGGESVQKGKDFFAAKVLDRRELDLVPRGGGAVAGR